MLRPIFLVTATAAAVTVLVVTSSINPVPRALAAEVSSVPVVIGGSVAGSIIIGGSVLSGLSIDKCGSVFCKRKQAVADAMPDAAAFIAEGGARATPLLREILNQSRLEIAAARGQEFADSLSDLELAENILKLHDELMSTQE